MRLTLAALAAVLVTLAAALALGHARADPMRLRTCDGRWRHVTCHWAGGDPATEWTVPPSESLGYGLPTLSSTDRGRIRIVAGACEIVCDAAPSATPPAAGKLR